jgi:hypothetical protein
MTLLNRLLAEVEQGERVIWLLGGFPLRQPRVALELAGAQGDGVSSDKIAARNSGENSGKTEKWCPAEAKKSNLLNRGKFFLCAGSGAQALWLFVLSFVLPLNAVVHREVPVRAGPCSCGAGCSIP